jgi:hypothetical protein
MAHLLPWVGSIHIEGESPSSDGYTKRARRGVAATATAVLLAGCSDGTTAPDADREGAAHRRPSFSTITVSKDLGVDNPDNGIVTVPLPGFTKRILFHATITGTVRTEPTSYLGSGTAPDPPGLRSFNASGYYTGTCRLNVVVGWGSTGGGSMWARRAQTPAQPSKGTCTRPQETLQDRPCEPVVRIGRVLEGPV